MENADSGCNKCGVGDHHKDGLCLYCYNENKALDKNDTELLKIMLGRGYHVMLHESRDRGSELHDNFRKAMYKQYAIWKKSNVHEYIFGDDLVGERFRVYTTRALTAEEQETLQKLYGSVEMNFSKSSNIMECYNKIEEIIDEWGIGGDGPSYPGDFLYGIQEE